MKKIIFMIFAFVFMVSHSGRIQAKTNEYPYLTFVTNEGATTLTVASLSIQVDGENLVVTDAEGVHTFVLEHLQKMYFSSSSSSVEDLNSTVKEKTEVYNLKGELVGTYANRAEAVNALETGIYVLKSKSGTIKIAIR